MRGIRGNAFGCVCVSVCLSGRLPQKLLPRLTWLFYTRSIIPVRYCSESVASQRAFVPRVYHEFSKRNIRYIAAVTYNSTSDSVIAKIYTHSLIGFSTYVKNQIIEHYNNRCNIEHCYSCRQHLNILNIWSKHLNLSSYIYVCLVISVKYRFELVSKLITYYIEVMLLGFFFIIIIIIYLFLFLDSGA